MKLWSIFGIGTVAIIGAGVAVGLAKHRSAMAEANRAFASIADTAPPVQRRFDPEKIRGLPEIARRYFRHAIAPGTPLYSTAELRMHGTFLLGHKGEVQTYRMEARQVLRAPDQFVWIPALEKGPLSVTGSDGLASGSAWTRFWLAGVIPVVNARTSPDLVRSAQFRSAVESAIWLPVSLLPGNGVLWEQTGADTARLTFERFDPAIELSMTLDETGAVREVVGQRWSNANPQNVFRLQPFGGTMLEEATSEGLTVPSRIAVGNHFGTDDYLPFFQATVSEIRYR